MNGAMQPMYYSSNDDDLIKWNLTAITIIDN
jgi:hypothetical protein